MKQEHAGRDLEAANTTDDAPATAANGHASMDPGVGLPPPGMVTTGNGLHHEPIPDIVIRRLPVYVRTLRGLEQRGITSVSSDELAGHIGVTAAQIRRDLTYFGKFGKQGKGYDTGFLADTIAHILRLERQWDVALAGLGNLGQAIVNYRGFRLSSFDIVSLFDSNPRHIGQEIEGMTVHSADQIQPVVEERGIQVGIIAVRADAAQEIVAEMIAGGIRSILNYAPVVLKVPDGVTVREIDPVSALQSMTYYLDERSDMDAG